MSKHPLLYLVLTLALASPTLGGGKFDIRERGATGDGQTSDTVAIQAAIDACAEAGGGQVLFPSGRYLSGTIHLRSGVTLHLDAGARLIGTTNLAHYTQPHPPEFMPEAKWGKWHRALIVGENVEDVAIMGPGVIDGNKVFDATGEEKMRGPHTIALVNSRRFTLRDVTIVDSANYAVFFQISDDVEIRNVKIVGGWDGVHWRGAPERWCQNVNIIGCQFFTGDDAMAGRYWNNTVIKDCLINSSCNGIRLIGPATRLTIANKYARNVATLTLEDVRFSLSSDDFRPVLSADRVERLNLDNFKFTRVAGVTEPILTTNASSAAESRLSK